jgi:hypothetical protein
VLRSSSGHIRCMLLLLLLLLLEWLLSVHRAALVLEFELTNSPQEDLCSQQKSERQR